MTPEAEYQLEHVLVALRVDAAELAQRPVAEAGPLVVDEYSAVLHLRLAVGERTFLYIYVFVLLRWHVGKPVPRRHAHLPRQLVCAVDGAALVASGYDEGARYAVQGAVNYLQEILLRLAFKLLAVHLSGLDELLYEGRLQAAHDDALALRLLRHRRLRSADATEVVGQVGHGHLHTLEIVLSTHYVDGLSALHYGKASAHGGERDKRLDCSHTDGEAHCQH